jgi:hypothetical protein
MAHNDMLRFRQRALAFTTCLTVQEFLAARPELRDLFCARRDEVRLSPAAQLFFTEYPDTLHLVALVNDALPETAIVTPVWARIADACPRADLRVLVDDGDTAALETMVNDPDALAELDGVELPQLLVFDDEWQLQARWGPRPPAADAYLDEWLAGHPEYEALADTLPAPTPEAQQAFAALNRALACDMRIWYNSGLDRDCVQGVQAVLAALQDEADGGEIADSNADSSADSADAGDAGQ